MALYIPLDRHVQEHKEGEALAKGKNELSVGWVRGESGKVRPWESSSLNLSGTTGPTSEMCLLGLDPKQQGQISLRGRPLPRSHTELLVVHICCKCV